VADNKPFYEDDEVKDALTKEEQLLRKQNDDDLLFLVNTPQGARQYLNQIKEGYIYNDEIFTGNSRAFYLLGMRQVTLNLMKALMSVLEIEDFTDLIVFLKKKSKEE
jgi:hypothetical protein